DLRQAVTIATAHRIVDISRKSPNPRPLGMMLDARSFANAIVGLHATGGSTNHSLHLPAIAAAAGFQLTWQDFAELSKITPLLARIYPNGEADINHFHAAGGMGFIIGELLEGGLLDGTAHTVWGDRLCDYATEPWLETSSSGDELRFRKAATQSLDRNVLRPVRDPYAPQGGLQMLDGNLGKAVIKISAVAEKHHRIRAAAMVFASEKQVHQAVKEGRLNCDCVIVVRGQGPRANGMPELHGLTPILSNLLDAGHQIALVTDGRMSGASGRVPSAIHLSPEAALGGAIGLLQDGDIITLDARLGVLKTEADLTGRTPFQIDKNKACSGFGRALFAPLRSQAAPAEAGGGLNVEWGSKQDGS
ncbi:MAG: dihydroxy-acid dehydratase, partial [Pseudomonadota bacterium]